MPHPEEVTAAAYTKSNDYTWQFRSIKKPLVGIMLSRSVIPPWRNSVPLERNCGKYPRAKEFQQICIYQFPLERNLL